jgi:tetratricopeptide (TPR) repeat protein
MEQYQTMPGSDIPYDERAAAYAQEGRISEALDCYDQALRHNPDNDVILNNRAIALISLRRFQEAYDTAKRASVVNPGSTDVWINMGVALEKMDRFPEAAEAFERAIGIDPYNAYARALLGIIYQKMDMGEQAEAQNRKLQELVFPRVYAGLYFAMAAFLLGMLLGGIRSVGNKPFEITIVSQAVIVVFFLVICGLYLRSLRLWQEINRRVIIVPFPAETKTERRPDGMYLILAAMVIVFMVGIVTGTDIWNWLH